MELEYKLTDKNIEEITGINTKIFMESDEAKKRVRNIRLILLSLVIIIGVLNFSRKDNQGLEFNLLTAVTVGIIFFGIKNIIHAKKNLAQAYSSLAKDQIERIFGDKLIRWVLKEDVIIRYLDEEEDIIQNEEIKEIYREDKYISLIIMPNDIKFLIPEEVFENEESIEVFIQNIKNRIKD